ncbi:histidine--tRNA ligase [Polymorphobacter fuscus]|uniref:Histidine--tRNA ligase n=1 Tax=Sandarakinorhabdus fusca TaxID=1439888 RepID=A0A7C9GN62_9SPHN|nr:histidine--tRNA ligase [Polymorphobacter fuscus]KAB7648888.1 histidine--tRNA ligase [Polymorphobacter fuscus]MQT16475.1 histidine--tRNA ligase [Polymorphobacter fuscus]NJC07235.1 histidyl-tRNA synthetase [Polymorphobacter fuscus]
MSKVQKPRGTQDMIGEAAARFDHVIETFNRVRKLYGFGRVEVPVFEATSVFARSLGETTDVVSKEMYSFEDRGGESLTLRPEFTAGIARAYIENGWQQYAPLKVAAWGPLFRYERPQKGRFRQFHQLDAEVIGAAEPAADVEVIALGQQLLNELGVAGDVVLQLNTLGDAETRSAWRDGLVAHFSAHRDVLSPESLERLAKNPLRILDSKAEADRALVADAPRIDAYMTSEAGAFFEAVQKGLQASGVDFVRAESLVRGFDYYRHTAFEFVTQALGAQGTVIGGGRYDGLIGAMGGPETAAVGWAGGIERLAMLVAEPRENGVVAVVPDSPELQERAEQALRLLRDSRIPAEMAYRGNAKRQVEIAKKRATHAILFVRGADAPQPYYIQHLGRDEAMNRISQIIIERALGPEEGRERL